MRLLFVGDVVGSPGRATLEALLPGLRERHEPDFVVVNGENAAGGLGITPKIASAWLEAGVDVITTGNHIWQHREVYSYLDSEPRIIRPANFPPSSPGRGHTVFESAAGRLGVVNVLGSVFVESERSPFPTVDEALEELDRRADWIVVDFHAEATSEKVAMGWHLDGRTTACFGTHTHVPTADGRVLPGGTAYISDVGMTGPRGGVIGVKRDQALKRFRTMLPQRFETSEEDLWLNAVLVEAGSDGRATSIDQLLLPGDGSGPSGADEP